MRIAEIDQEVEAILLRWSSVGGKGECLIQGLLEEKVSSLRR